MPSSATLTTLRTRCQNLLIDTSVSLFPTATIDEGIAQALDEYNRYKPMRVVGTLTPPANDKLVSLSALTGLLDVTKVWFPYTASFSEDPPCELTDWYLEFDAGVPKIYLGDSAYTPDGVIVARAFYTKPHTLNGLAGASATTYPATDDGLIVQGAAGYAAAMMVLSAPIIETQIASDRLLKAFRAGLV